MKIYRTSESRLTPRAFVTAIAGSSIAIVIPLYGELLNHIFYGESAGTYFGDGLGFEFFIGVALAIFWAVFGIPSSMIISHFMRSENPRARVATFICCGLAGMLVGCTFFGLALMIGLRITPMF